MDTQGKRQSLVEKLEDRRRQQIMIAVDDTPDRDLREVARERGWTLVNVWYCGGELYPWLHCQGALVSSLPDSHLVQNLLKRGCKVVRLGQLPHPMDHQISAVLGVGNSIEICESSLPPLSSLVNWRKAQVGAACDLLAGMMAGKPQPATPIMIPPSTMVERQSTNVLAVDQPVVVRALRFIWDHSSEPLTVNDVAEAVAVSRSKLNRLFRQHFPRAVKEELNRKRLQSCRQLLRNTDWNMSRVAAIAGFRSPEYMRAAFGKAFALSPRDFRNQCRKDRQ